MISLQKTFQFKYTWRTYQHRFLNGFESHIEDGHLHVVAPPGSGKTVLGLQRRFGFSNYFAVPSVFAERKEDALLFFKYWKIYKGSASLIFTRNPEGRKKLLKVRFHYLNTEGGFKTKTAAIWK